MTAYYINLDSRPDRREKIEEELSIFNKVVRVPAYSHRNGAFGLAKTALELLDTLEKSEDTYSFVFEDDHQWELPKHEVQKVIEEIVHLNCNMVLLTFHIPVVNIVSVRYPLAIVSNAQTASAYMIHKRFIPELRACFEISVQNKAVGQYAIDQTWKILQDKEGVYATLPRLGRQRAGYSDIEGREADYGGGCFMAIMSCEKYQSRRETQVLKDCPFPWRYFVGDPKTFHSYEKGSIVYLPCEDNYESLPQKVRLAVLWVYTNYPNLDYVCKTDDDIVFKFGVMWNAFAAIARSKADYAGEAITFREHLSRYHYGKCEDPGREVPVVVKEGSYCPGGCYFLSKKSMRAIIGSPTEYKEAMFEDVCTGSVLKSKGIIPSIIKLNGKACFWE